jgi:pimeloyl-ACP methyl ester carboxylesterase
MKIVRTAVLEMAYEEYGPADGKPLMIIHGWPDSPRGWLPVAEQLANAGWYCVVPYLRGFAPTRFLHSGTPRDGSAVALVQDVIDLADLLGWQQFAVVGHDWGARAAYTLSLLFPERITRSVTLALGHVPKGAFEIPSFSQAKNFWYQWLMCVDKAVEQKIAADPIGFARVQWDTWSPVGWFDEAEFAATAESFLGPDWLPITLNAYRSRWMPGEASDERYNTLKEQLSNSGKINIPTLLIQGQEDYCDPPSETENQAQYFTKTYQRVLVDGVGHFPHRDAPDTITKIITDYLG